MSQSIEFDDAFTAIRSQFELAPELTADGSPFGGHDDWELIGDRHYLGDLLDELNIEVHFYRSARPDQALIFVRTSIWSTGQSMIPRVQAITIDSSESYGMSWEAYYLNCSWQGEWSELSATQVTARAKQIRSGKAGL